MRHPQSSTQAGTIYVTASTYKDHALQLAHRVARTGEEVVVTVRGQPLAKLSSVVRRSGNRFVGAGRQAVRVQGGIGALDALTAPRRPAGNGGDGAAEAAALLEGPRRLAIGAPHEQRDPDATRALLAGGAAEGGGEQDVPAYDEHDLRDLGNDLAIELDPDATT